MRRCACVPGQLARRANSALCRPLSPPYPRCSTLHRFAPDDLARVGLPASQLAYFLVTGDSPQGGKPGRRYPWGEVDAADGHHSDLIALKRLLTGDKVGGHLADGAGWVG